MVTIQAINATHNNNSEAFGHLTISSTKARATNCAFSPQNWRAAKIAANIQLLDDNEPLYGTELSQRILGETAALRLANLMVTAMVNYPKAKASSLGVVTSETVTGTRL